MARRNILVTGGGSGIGKAICEQLAAKGHHVFVTDMNVDAAAQVASGITVNGGSASAHKLNVTDVAEIESLVASFGDKTVDILINNAGIQHVSRLEDFPADKWKLLIEVMLIGASLLTKAVLPGMRRKGFGRIINIGSIHGVIASPFKSAYVAAKHGLIGFSKTIALETGDTDITINTICPSYVKTPLVEAQIAAQARENKISEDQVIKEIMLKPMPKGVFIEMEEITGTIEFLMSSAARNMTGQNLIIDGGWTVR